MHSHHHEFLTHDPKIAKNEKRTLGVVVLTATMMCLEIVFGKITGSMALTADGWHMASHACALGIAYLTYKLAKSDKYESKFNFGTGKFIPLGGYTSAVILAMVALIMMFESSNRLLSPVSIQFNEAILVAVIGLVVNLASIAILHDHGDHHHNHSHEDHHHHDHNYRGAYLHVIADAMTSVFAIIALVAGKYYSLIWLDPLMGILGALLILKWAFDLAKNTGWELLDGHARNIDRNMIVSLIENNETKITDLHVWRIAPRAHACELVISSTEKKGSEFYRKLLTEKFDIHHVIIEET